MTAYLPHLNATLNATAAICLVWGYVLIKRGHEQAHKRVMLGSFVISIVFLASYLVYHAQVGSKYFPDYPPLAIQYAYKLILLTHIVLAVTVPFLAVITILLGLRDRRLLHRRFARWTFPIWLYVSVTGVVVYLMLYWCFPPREPQEASGRQVSVFTVQWSLGSSRGDGQVASNGQLAPPGNMQSRSAEAADRATIPQNPLPSCYRPDSLTIDREES